MADSIRPAIKRAPSSPTFYEIRRPEGTNSHSNALGLNYPLFLIGAVIISVILLFIRNNHSKFKSFYGPGLEVSQDVSSPIEQIPNITQRLNQQAAGSYDPAGSTATAASYTGVI